MGRGFRALLLAIVLPAAWIASSSSASAVGACSGTNVTYHTGYYQQASNQYEGISSYIIVEDGTNCTGATANTWTNAYNLVGGNATHAGYGQVGFERTAGHTLRWFSAFNPSGQAVDEVTRFSTFGVTNQIGVRHIFRVLWLPTCSCLHAYIDGTDWDSSLFNPYLYYGSLPWDLEYMAEVTWPQTLITGSSTNPTLWTGEGGQRFSDDVIESIPAGFLAATPAPNPGDPGYGMWARHQLSNTSTETWDN